MLSKINNKDINIKDTDFKNIPNEEWFNLRIVDDLPALERMVGLIKEVKDSNKITLYNVANAGWLILSLSEVFDKIEASFASLEDQYLTIKNLDLYGLGDKLDIIETNLTNCIWMMDKSSCWKSQGPNRKLWVQQGVWLEGCETLHSSYIKGEEIVFDNLINFLVMVKNGGPEFKKMLEDNLHLIDRWTILDTGSTDGTQDVVRQVLQSKCGTLYEEPFVDFKVSRNRLLELAGTHCKYNLMLDDTYVVVGKLREFLETIRGDQFAHSYSLYIRSYDSEYSSNRITKSEFGLRYIHRIHEVIDPKDNVNVMIPNTVCYIDDRKSDYMDKRTKDRKQWDLETLFKEYEEYPSDPRNLYYIAQTYSCLEDHEKTYEFFLKRANHPNQGFLQEKIDAIFEAGRTANFKLDKPWEECERLYQWAYELDPSRPDSLYFLGIHWYLLGDKFKAYPYFKKAFEVGYPLQAQYSLKPTLSYHFLPKFLSEVCYHVRDWKLGLESSGVFCTKNPQTDPDWYIQHGWNLIFQKLVLIPTVLDIPIIHDRPVATFCVDGNWQPWTGSDIETKGMGGSETWAIETARWMTKGGYDVYVFCRCSKQEVYDGVNYKDLSEYPTFISNNRVNVGYVSRNSEWLPMTYEGHVDEVYLWVHDLTPTVLVIPDHVKLKGMVGLSKWHEELLKQTFPSMVSKIKHQYYGIDEVQGDEIKVKDRFIYSSTANRGLEHLLDMWSDILTIKPNATLEVFCDLDLEWANRVAPEAMSKIKSLIKQDGVIYRGWQSKTELIKGWKRSEYWLYPCVFQETFCLTALEAALYKVMPITNGLASLNETAGKGVIIQGNPASQEWKKQALETLKAGRREDLIETNYQWAKSLTWKNQTQSLTTLYTRSKTFIEQIVSKTINNPKHYHILKIGAFTGDIPNDEVYHDIKHNSKIILIEPIPTYFEKLKLNFDKKYPNNNFTYINSAVSNTNGSMLLHYPSEANDFKTLPWWIKQLGSKNDNHCKNHGYDIKLDSVNVKSISINDLIKNLKITNLELLIVDTEGCDYDILMAMDFGLLKPKFIQVEHMHLFDTKNRGDRYDKLLDRLKYYGYTKISENQSDVLLMLDV